jgi:hypothetical protein
MVKKTIRFTVRVKGCPIEFREGMGDGVVAIQDVEYGEGRFGFDSGMFHMAIYEKTKELMDEHFEVTYEEVQE